MKASTTLDRQSLPNTRLWLAIFILLAAGAIMVYSSSFIFAQERYHDGMHFLKRHGIFMALGLAAFAGGRKLSVEQLRKALPWLVVVTFALLCAALIPGIAHKAGGASRWISIFGFSFQPAELTKFTVVLFLASQVARKIDQQDNFRTGFLTYFLGVIPLYALLLLQPDFGTVALLLCTTFCVLVACGARLKYLITTAAVLLPTAATLILISPYRRARLIGFLDPWSDPAHKGFQIIQSLLAFFAGKWFGVGIGNSKEKLFYLPEAHNDFIFAVVGEELGFIGVLFFVALFLTVVLHGLSTAQRLEDKFEKALAVGISCVIGLQAFFNMAVVLGLLPTKGLPLPLISYGGSSLIFTLLMLGILSRLSERAHW